MIKIVNYNSFISLIRESSIVLEKKLYNEDCIVGMQKIDTNSIDLIITDPTYNLGNFMKNRDTNLSKMRDNFFGSAGWDDMEFSEWENSMLEL